MKIYVNCRIGSLEIGCRKGFPDLTVNCRIGSLEIAGELVNDFATVNCRIGSLEIMIRAGHGSVPC